MKLFLGLSLLFLVSLYTVSAITISGADPSGNIYTSDSAQGSIVEKQVLSADSTYNSSIFSDGGPIKNGTNAADMSVSGLGISALGDIYVVTTGPDITDPVPAAVTPTPSTPSTPESSSVPSAGGGGGGSSHRDTYGLIVGDVVTVVIEDSPHEIEIVEVKESSAVLAIDGASPVEIQLKETITIDVDGDSIDDISITLDSVSELKKITITVTDLTTFHEAEEVEEQPTSLPESLEQITGAVSALPVQEIAQATVAISKKTSVILTYIVGMNLIVGLLVASVFATKKYQQRRIYNVFHAPSKQELIQKELAKVQNYVSSAMESGRAVHSIKQELLGVGWQEYEIDTIMVDAMLKEEEFFNRIQ